MAKKSRNNNGNSSGAALLILKIILIITFFPIVIIYLIWAKSNLSKKGKLISSASFLVLLLLGVAFSGDKEDVKTVSTNNQPQITTIATTVADETTEPAETTKKETTTTEKVTTAPEETTIEETTEIIFLTTKLYDDIFLHFKDSVGEATFDEIKEYILSLDYNYEITEPTEEDLGTFKVYDESGNYVYICCYLQKSNNIETMATLNYHNAETENEITISDASHTSKIKYETFDKSKETPRSEVNSLDDLLKFMFDVETVSETTSVAATIPETVTTTVITTTTVPATTTTAPVTTTILQTEPPQTFPPITEAPKVVTQSYVLNTSTMKVHKSTCRDVDKIAVENYAECNDLQWALNNGYDPCGHCHP